MITYSEWSPTGFDPDGAFLPDQQDWLCGPTRTRDSESEPLTASNWEATVKALDEVDTGEDYNITSFGHWACGWVELILVRPCSQCAEVLADIEKALENYPVLDDVDFSRREWESFCESWNDWGADAFRDALATNFRLDDDSVDALDEVDNDTLRDAYMAHAGVPYEMESSGPFYSFKMKEYPDNFVSNLIDVEYVNPDQLLLFE